MAGDFNWKWKFLYLSPDYHSRWRAIKINELWCAFICRLQNAGGRPGVRSHAHTDAHAYVWNPLWFHFHIWPTFCGRDGVKLTLIMCVGVCLWVLGQKRRFRRAGFTFGPSTAENAVGGGGSESKCCAESLSTDGLSQWSSRTSASLWSYRHRRHDVMIIIIAVKVNLHTRRAGRAFYSNSALKTDQTIALKLFIKGAMTTFRGITPFIWFSQEKKHVYFKKKIPIFPNFTILSSLLQWFNLTLFFFYIFICIAIFRSFTLRRAVNANIVLYYENTQKNSVLTQTDSKRKSPFTQTS